MRSLAVRSKLTLELLALLATVAILLWAWSERGAEPRALEMAPVGGDESQPRAEDEFVTHGNSASRAARELEPHAPAVRTEVVARPEPRTLPATREPESPLPVFGTVLDELRRPVPSVEVGVTRGSPRTPDRRGVEWSGSHEFLSGSIVPTPLLPKSRLRLARIGVATVAVTDVDGSFELTGENAREGGELVFAPRLYLGEPPRQVVIRDGAQQSLSLPRRPTSAPLVVIRLTDSETGARVYPDRVAAELVSLLPQPTESDLHTGPLPPRRGRRHPRADQVHRQDGRVELELWPGRWHVSLFNERSSTVDVRFVVPLEGPALEIDAEVTLFAERDGWELLDPAALSGPALAPDTAQGFDEFGPEHYHERELGDRRSDSHFRRTLRFGPGAVRSAHLELDLEAASGMARNDALHLEFMNGSPKFGFSTSLSKLAGGAWRPPQRRRFFLDLGNLSGKDGPVSLLDDLADGRLDIYLADDTAIHGLRLFVSR